MLIIDQLSLALPPGFEHRAMHISRLVAHELSRLPLAGHRTIEALSIPRVEVTREATDAQVAVQVAHAIHAAMGGEP